MVSVVNNGFNITVNANSSTININKKKVYVSGSVDGLVKIGWTEDDSITFPYTEFSAPAGASAAAVAQGVADLVNL